MKLIRAKLFTTILGVISLLSCQYQEEDIVNQTSNIENTANYYDLLEESLNEVFNETYENITINTTFYDMANMFERNSIDFFASKGYIITNSNIAHTRGEYSSPFDRISNLDENQKLIINKVSITLQLPVYQDVRLGITQLYDEILNQPTQDGKEEVLRYVKYIDNMLIFLEQESGKIDVLNILAKYNEFHEIQRINTRTTPTPLSDGVYPHPLDETKFIVVTGGHVYEFSCSAGLVFSHSARACIYPDGRSNKQ